MSTRRDFVRASTASLASLALTSCGDDSASSSYDDAARRIWRTTSPAAGSVGTPPIRELVRYATLAPSSHNTQCWRFAVEAKGINILPDLTRRCPAVDPDDHHLFVSLGCATENLVQAALAHGWHGDVASDVGAGGVHVALTSTRPESSESFRAITFRQSTRGLFDGASLSASDLGALELAGTGNGVHVRLVVDDATAESVLALAVTANTTQMHDDAFVRELKHWIRFNDADAVRTGDGLFSRCTGNPTMPSWIARPLFPLVFRADSENDKLAAQVRSSAGIAVFVSDCNDHAHWIETGRCFQRFALQATALGVRTAMINQPVEVASSRSELAQLLSVGEGRPDLVVRFGRGAATPRSLRRPIEDVIV